MFKKRTNHRISRLGRARRRWHRERELLNLLRELADVRIFDVALRRERRKKSS